jgi:4-diphosphocytidyl-2-C-methyl-D-erythritol kinase
LSLKEIIIHPIESWKKNLVNDFEEIIFPRYPEIRSIKEKLYESGAVYASMSGSGSAVYGIFKKEKDIRVSFPSTYFLKESIGQRQ